MSSPLENLEPKLLWKNFDDIRRIPRPSKHEERIVEHTASRFSATTPETW